LKLDRDEIYEEIKTASEQMVDLLDSLRELAREDNLIAPIPASLNQTIRRAVDAVRARPELRNLEISINSSGEMDGVFDPKKIERAFFNLVLNACEATVPSQGYVRIEICSIGESFAVRVADNGTGIPSCIATSLFDPFVSVGKPNGTGLGLAIVNKIVQDHGGSVTVETTSESGTTFLVRLPRAAHVETVVAQTVVS
jgi:signal transduction histidine kinase